VSVSKPVLTGKIALITGASRGIGRAIAQRFAAAGATVIVTARSLNSSVMLPGTLAETVALIERANGKAIPLAADLEISEERDNLIKNAVSAAGGLDILVNNAGVAHYSSVEKMPGEMFDITVDHYLRNPFYLSRAAIPILRERGAGWILNIGSVSALAPQRPYAEHYDHFSGIAVYGAVKAALNRFTQGLAAELEAANIAVNLVAPSTMISTPGADRFIPADMQCERVEYLAETALALCHLPAKELTGVIAHSLHYSLARNLDVFTLDGQDRLGPPNIPSWAYPDVNVQGF
jgi:NAD(P)-dependent dehydrogenase (short-subunit alcohol dehydrogenase family)